jgi:hypothetical protein
MNVTYAPNGADLLPYRRVKDLTTNVKGDRVWTVDPETEKVFIRCRGCRQILRIDGSHYILPEGYVNGLTFGESCVECPDCCGSNWALLDGWEKEPEPLKRHYFQDNPSARFDANKMEMSLRDYIKNIKQDQERVRSLVRRLQEEIAWTRRHKGDRRRARLEKDNPIKGLLLIGNMYVISANPSAARYWKLTEDKRLLVHCCKVDNVIPAVWSITRDGVICPLPRSAGEYPVRCGYCGVPMRGRLEGWTKLPRATILRRHFTPRMEEWLEAAVVEAERLITYNDRNVEIHEKRLLMTQGYIKQFFKDGVSSCTPPQATPPLQPR